MAVFDGLGGPSYGRQLRRYRERNGMKRATRRHQTGGAMPIEKQSVPTVRPGTRDPTYVGVRQASLLVLPKHRPLLHPVEAQLLEQAHAALVVLGDQGFHGGDAVAGVLAERLA